MIDTILQVIMLACTLLYSYFLLDCRRKAFLYGTVASIITCYTFFKSGVYIQGVLFGIYAVVYMISYFKWSDNVSEELPQNITTKQLYTSLIFLILFTIILGILLNGTEYFMIDAITSALSILGVSLLNKKIIEHAYYFIISNLGSIWICYVTNEKITLITFIVYLSFNILRIYQWNKLRREAK